MSAQSIRNADGYWINTEVFKEEANHFTKYGYYCPDPPGSDGYSDYWKEQTRRCIHGYESGGVKITGDFYSYLNFHQIKLTEDQRSAKGIKGVVENNKKGRIKKVAFPAFYDGDYDYYWNVEIAKSGIDLSALKDLQLLHEPIDIGGGKYVCVGKARRKGFSYKNASLVNNKFNFIPNSVSIVAAYLKSFLYPDGTMKMVTDYMNFTNQHTAWGKKREYVDKINHKKASYKFIDPNTGLGIEKGLLSQVYALTCKDNPDALRGKDGTLILFEEGGKFPNIIDTYKATDPTLRDGDFVTGMIIIFGTGSGASDKEADWEGFSEIFYNPKQYNMISFPNDYDKEFEGESCSYFFPDNLCFPGYIDKQGNSDLIGAKKKRLEERESIIEEAGIGSSAANGHLQEYAHAPSEAFLVSNHNDFNTALIREQWNKVKLGKYHKNLGDVIKVFRDEEGIAQYKIDHNPKNPPILNWKPKLTNLKGCIVMFEPPVLNPPAGLYIGGLDPVRQNTAFSSESLNVTYIEKGHNDFSYMGGNIVAAYIGRPADIEDYLSELEILLDLYSATLMHENEVMEVRNYFKRRGRLDLLIAQPDAYISANVKESNVRRIWGTHMVEGIKNAGLSEIARYIMKEVVIHETGEKIRYLNRIYDPGLLEELLKYDRIKDKEKKANYDRIMAYMMIRIARLDESLNLTYSRQNRNKIAKKLVDLSRNQFDSVSPNKTSW